MANRTSSKTKVKTSTSVQQTLSVLQNVFECSIAGICKDRNLFPSTFFQDFETNTNCLNVTKFDLDYLLDDNNDYDKGENEIDIDDSRSSSDDRGGTMFSNDIVDEVELNANLNTTHFKNDDENDGNHNNDQLQQGIHRNEYPTLSQYSPLTSHSVMSSTYYYEHASNHTLSNRSNNTLNNNCQTQICDHHHDRYYKNEALLLLHWIRNGVLEMIKRDQLARFVFAICIPKSTTNMNASTTGARSMKRRKLDDNVVVEGSQEDQIVESYVFDIPQCDFMNMNDKCNSNKQQKVINHGKLKDEYDALFRNLQTFAKTILQSPSSTSSFITSNMSSSSRIHKQPKDRVNDSKTMIPASRYFNVRVEFKSKQEKNRNKLLPWALHPSSEVNKNFYVHNEYTTSVDVERSCSAHISVNASKNHKGYQIPSITHALQSLVHVPLGHVIEANVTGLGVKLIACHCDDDNEDIVEETSDYNDGQNGQQMIVSSNYNIKTNEPSTKVLISKSLSRSQNHKQNESEYNRFTNYIISNGTRAFALPYTQHTKLNNKNTKVNNKMKNDNYYLPCKILDHRIGKKTKLDYKVQFFDQELEKASMKKQWVRSTKVVLFSEMRERVFNELELNGTIFSHSVPSSTLQHIASMLKIDVVNIKELMFSGTKNEKEMKPQKLKNNIRLEGMDCSQENCCHEQNENFRLVYSYAMDPITVVI